MKPVNGFLLWALLLGGLTVVAPSLADDGMRKRVADWLTASLSQALSAEGPADMNRVASLVYPLANYWRDTADVTAGDALTRVGWFLRELKTESLDCGVLADVFLTQGFLRQAGLEVHLARDVESRLKNCVKASTRFDLANMLMFVCRYTDWPVDERLPGGLERLVQAQRSDGGFVDEQGRPSYYLTSHALVALHYCGASRDVIARTQAGMAQRLSPFRLRGFNDGLAESLIFLRWTGGDTPGYADYLAYLKGRVKPEGSLCFNETPDCSGDWHATSLVLELLNLEASDRGVSDGVNGSNEP